MSIVTLKRKTFAKYNNSSVSQPQFSINGTTRNQGFVGQTMLSRSLPRTLMRGNVERGYGGLQGTYLVTPIVSSAVTSTENSNVIKKSVLDYDGMSEIKYQYIRRPQPFSSTKPVSNSFNYTDQYIPELRQCVLSNTAPSAGSVSTALPTNCGNGFRTSYTKSLSVATSQGEYLLTLDGTCAPTPIVIQNSNGTPLPSHF